MGRKILIISQHFWPENFRITDIAKGFAEKGIQVDVLCGIPNYPDGNIYTGYGFLKNKKQVLDGVNIYRTLEIPRKGNSSLRIFLNYMSFPFFAAFRVLCFLGRRYDRVFCYETSPVYMIFPAVLYSKFKGIPLTSYVLDLWPENLYSVLDIKNKIARKFLYSTSLWHYKKSDKLIAMSQSLCDRLVRRTGKDPDRVALIPNYCEELYEKDVYDGDLEEKYRGYFKVVYAGNISPAQDLGIAADCALILKKKGITDIKFIIVGDGMSREDVRKYVSEIGVEDYFEFVGKKPVFDMPRYHTLADCLLATLAKSDDIGLTIPAKITSYLAAGRPILTAMDGEGSLVVKRAHAGLTGPRGDRETLRENLVTLYGMSLEERKALGDNARRYHLENHSRERILEKLVDFIFD